MSLEELMPEKSKAIREFIARRAVPVYGASPEKRWPVGTGTLFEVNSRLYLITAGHVVRDNLAQEDRFRLALPVDQACSKLLAPKTLGGCYSQKDRHDVAVFALDDEAAAVLRSGWGVVEPANLAAPRSAGPFLLFGYLRPCGERSGHTPPGEFIGVNAMHYTGEVSSTEGFDPVDDLLLEYPSEPIDLLTQRPLDPPRLEGLSGCSVWELLPDDGEHLWTPASQLRLVAIQSAALHGSYIRTKRWHLLWSLIGQFDPSGADEVRRAISS